MAIASLFRVGGKVGMMMKDVFTSEEELSVAAARLFVKRAAEAIVAKGTFQVVLSGGQTPRRMYELLAAFPLCEQVEWDKVHVFWGDERYVEAEDKRSNQRLARESLLQHVPIRAEHIYPIPFSETPASAASEYESTLKKIFFKKIPTFDLILLGLGNDGHTASLFPNTAALSEQEHWVTAVQHPQDGDWRITLTYPVLNHAAAIVFIVAGETKAATIRRILQDDQLSGLPAEKIHLTSGQVYWLLDQAAAKGLVG